METDMNSPIDDSNFGPPPPMLQTKNDNGGIEYDDAPNLYYDETPRMNHFNSRPIQQEKKDFFGDLDKTTWIVFFSVFILGFFMGKTMQPVILRHS